MAEPYQILGVAPGAAFDEIKSAYRKLAFKYHPDHNKDPGAEAKFKEIDAAYQTLKDGGNPPLAPIGPIDHWNITTHAVITLEEAIFGTTKEVEYHQLYPCANCNGRGSLHYDCPTCAGLGAIHVVSSINFDGKPFTLYNRCKTCGGRGGMRTCVPCQGRGSIPKVEKSSVTFGPIVPSITGTRVVVAGVINPKDHLCFRGDLSVVVSVLGTDGYMPLGPDIHRNEDVPFSTFVRGGTVSCDYFGGKTVRINVPEQTKPGHLVRIEGLGIRTSPPGDLLIHVNVKMPATRAEREQLAHDLLTFEPASHEPARH